MEFKERLVFCNKCENKIFDFKTGVLCGITHQKPNFEVSCPDFEVSTLEKQKTNAKEYTKKLNNQEHNFKDDFSAKNDKDKLLAQRKAFLNELKESEYVNRSQNQEAKPETPAWRIALSIIIGIVALVRLIMALT